MNINFSEIRAECLKKLETGGLPESKGGERPRSVRKRGFHRAVKRGEIWALLEIEMKESMKKIFNRLYADAACQSDRVYSICGLKNMLEDPK